MQSKVTDDDPRFTELLAGELFALLRAAGITMLPSTAMERVRVIAGKIAEAVQYRAEEKAVKVAKKLQEVVSTAFASVETDMEELRAKIKKLEDQAKKPSNNT